MASSSFGEAVSLTQLHQRARQSCFLDSMPKYGIAADWNPSLEDVLAHEGGNDDDPRDPGGRTSRGIIQIEWDAWRKAHPGNNWPADVWKAPQEQIEAIYKQKYWNALRCDDLPAGVDYCVFDYGVNSGIGRAGKVLRRLLALPDTDWHVTDEVLAALKVRDPKVIINQICDERLKFLRGLATWATFGNGWNRRVSEVRHDSLDMAAKVRAPAPTIPIIMPPKPVPLPNAPELHDLGHDIKRTMLARGYPWFYDQNVISVEGMNPDGTPNKNRPNAFDDIKMVLDGSGKIINRGGTGPRIPWQKAARSSSRLGRKAAGRPGTITATKCGGRRKTPQSWASAIELAPTNATANRSSTATSECIITAVTISHATI
jgi:lysozyme family protein